MLRRVAILLIVSIVVGAGVTACPRPAACAMSVQARHACCDRVALQTSRCCCSERPAAPSLLRTIGANQPDHGSKGLALVPGWQPAMVHGFALAARYHRLGAGGLAPPDTPLRNHTLLLL